MHFAPLLLYLRGGIMSGYKTVRKRAEDEYIVKKSRFIGYAAPVTTQQQALDFIAEISKKHWDATHNVYCLLYTSPSPRDRG